MFLSINPIVIRLEIFKGEVSVHRIQKNASNDDKLLADEVEKLIKKAFEKHHKDKSKSAIDI